MGQPSLLTTSPDSPQSAGLEFLTLSQPISPLSRLCQEPKHSDPEVHGLARPHLSGSSNISPSKAFPDLTEYGVYPSLTAPPTHPAQQMHNGTGVDTECVFAVSSDSLQPRGLFQLLACLPSASHTCKFHERQDSLFWLSATCPDPALRRPSGSVCRMNKHVHVSHTQVTLGTMGSSGMHGKFIIS